MKIDVQKLQSGPMELELDHRPVYFDLKGEEYKVLSNITGKLTLKHLNERVVMEGKVHALVRQQCVRCLGDVDTQVDKEAMVVYVRDEPEESEHYDPRKDHEEASHYKGKTIDLRKDIRELVLVDLPEYPLCDEECRGICPRCGRNQNKAECDCRDEWEPMEVKEKSWKEALKDIIKKKNQEDSA